MLIKHKWFYLFLPNQNQGASKLIKFSNQFYFHWDRRVMKKLSMSFDIKNAHNFIVL